MSAGSHKTVSGDEKFVKYCKKSRFKISQERNKFSNKQPNLYRRGYAKSITFLH